MPLKEISSKFLNYLYFFLSNEIRMEKNKLINRQKRGKDLGGLGCESFRRIFQFLQINDSKKGQ